MPRESRRGERGELVDKPTQGKKEHVQRVLRAPIFWISVAVVAAAVVILVVVTGGGGGGGGGGVGY
jgi:hypothetical protein